MLWEEGELATSATFCAPNRPGSSVEKQWQDFAREARNPRLERISEIQMCGLVIGGPVPSLRKSDVHNAISWQNTSEKDLEVSFKMKHSPTYNLTIPLLEFYSREMKVCFTQSHVHKCSPSLCSLWAQTGNNTNTYQQENKTFFKKVIYSDNGIPLSNEKECTGNKKNRLRNRQRNGNDIFLKKTYKWSTGTSKDAQHHSSSGKCTLNPQTSPQTC